MRFGMPQSERDNCDSNCNRLQICSTRTKGAERRGGVQFELARLCNQKTFGVSKPCRLNRLLALRDFLDPHSG